jgi:hypothetical protein
MSKMSTSEPLPSSKAARARATSSPTWQRSYYADDGPLRRLPAGLFSLLIVIAALVPIVRFIGVALQRIHYPFELEWIEGGSVSHIQVVLSGHQIYREPSIEFTPFIYPPLYYYVSALPTLAFGVGLFAPRLVSLLSILGCFVLLARWVREQTGDAVAGVVAAGLLASVYKITGFWMDLARVDALFLLFTLAANTLAQSTRTPARAVLVGLLLAAACFTKQLGIPLALPPLLFLALRSFRLGFIAALVAGLVLGVAGLAFYVSSSGWIYYYLFLLPARHPIQWSRLWSEVQTYFLGVTLLMTVGGVLLLCGAGFSSGRWKRWIHNTSFVVLATVTSFLPFLKSGGYPNGLIPAYAGLALAAGLVLAELRRGANSVLCSTGSRLFACLLVLFQCATLSYDPSEALPTAADLAANTNVVARMKALAKPILVTASSHYMRLIEGDTELLHTIALVDVFKGQGKEAVYSRALLSEALRSHHFRTIILDRAAGFLPDDIVDTIHQEYVAKGTLLGGVPGDVMWPKTGASIRPDTIWAARSPAK